MNRLAIDFGTSNTAAAVMVGGKPFVIELEPGNQTLPTAVFLDFDARKMRYGSEAVSALIDGRDGRFMRSLKRVLGTKLMREPRQLMNERLTLMDVVARFLTELKTRAEAQCHQSFDAVLSGRPLYFHSGDPARDAQAETDLRECYQMAGFKDVEFLFEPEAAALASGVSDTVGLVVDIGGGTSDFTVFSTVDGKPVIEASHGIRVGGTDFDRSICLDKVMPLFGMGTAIKNELGPGTYTAPNAMFQDLATWEKIAFLYTPENRRSAAYSARLAKQPELFARLVNVLDMELGHEVIFAVERGKIAANKSDPGWGMIDLRMVESGLSPKLAGGDLDRVLEPFTTKIAKAALETLKIAGCPESRVGKIVFVGGSSLMGVVEHATRAVLPNAVPEYSNAFTAVVDGLAIAAA